MSSNTVHLYFDGNHWRVRAQDATVPPRGPYDTYHAADSAAYDLARELSAAERHHDHGEVMREVCERDDNDNDPDNAGSPNGNGASLSRRVRGAVRRLLRRDRPRCRLVRIGTDRRAALAADKRHWTRTMAEIERMMEDPSSVDSSATQPLDDDSEHLPDDPGDPNDAEPPVPADLSRELESVLRGLPRAGDLLVEFWQTAERDGLGEAFDRLSIALADTGRDLTRVRALIERTEARS
jgi:hypothetical protein